MCSVKMLKTERPEMKEASFLLCVDQTVQIRKPLPFILFWDIKKCTRELPHLVIAMHIIWTLVCELPSEQCTKRHIPESPSLQLLTTSIQSMWLIDSSSKRIAVSSSSSDGFSLVFAIHIEYILYISVCWWLILKKCQFLHWKFKHFLDIKWHFTNHSP